MYRSKTITVSCEQNVGTEFSLVNAAGIGVGEGKTVSSFTSLEQRGLSKREKMKSMW